MKKMYKKLMDKMMSDPAYRWLGVSFFGFGLCFIAFGMHVTGGSNVSQPLPRKVMSQVFGFTPYYFAKDSPPSRLSLKPDSPKFLGNALSFELVKSAKESVIVSEKTMPTDYSAASAEGVKFETPEGTAVLGKVKDGRISGTLLTKDKTLISVEGPGSLNPDIIESVLRKLVPTVKPDLTQPQ